MLRTKGTFARLASLMLATLVLAALLPVSALAEGETRDSGPRDSGFPPPSGYTTDENGILAYRFTQNGDLDFQGVFDGKWKMTTYYNNGFSTYVKNENDTVARAQATGKPETIDKIPGMTVKIGTRFKSEGKVLKVTYLVANNSEADITYSLGSAADVQIGSDDSATISKLGAKGFKMISNRDVDKNANNEYAQFNHINFCTSHNRFLGVGT